MRQAARQGAVLEVNGRPVTVRAHPRRRRIAVHVTAAGVELRVPERFSVDRALAFVREKEPWIRRALRRAQEQEQERGSAPELFPDGAALPYLGRELELSVARARRPACELRGGVLEVFLPDGIDEGARQEAVRRVLEWWYMSEARRFLPPRVAGFAERVGVEPKRVSVGRSRSAWGSCSTSGRIRLSWRLMKVPPVRIDSVIVHELCHMVEHNHSPAFWREVGRHDPDYRDHNAWFRENEPRLMRW